MADEPRRRDDAALIIEEFDVAGDWEALLVPLAVEAYEYPFLVDTGASRVVFDKKLNPQLGRPKRYEQHSAVDGRFIAPIFDPPACQLGEMTVLQFGEVCSLDLAMMRQASGHEAYGILG